MVSHCKDACIVDFKFIDIAITLNLITSQNLQIQELYVATYSTIMESDPVLFCITNDLR